MSTAVRGLGKPEVAFRRRKTVAVFFPFRTDIGLEKIEDGRKANPAMIAKIGSMQKHRQSVKGTEGPTNV